MRHMFTVLIASLMLVGTTADATAKLSKQQIEELDGYVTRFAETTDAEAKHALLLVRGATADANARKALLALEGDEDARTRLGAKLSLALAGDKAAVGRAAKELLAQGADFGLLRWALAPLDDKLELEIVKAILKEGNPDQVTGTYRYLVSTYGDLFALAVAGLQSEHEATRQVVARDMLAAGREDVLPHLEKILAAKDEQIRYEATQLAGEFSKRASARVAAKKVLEAAANGGSARVRELAARRLVAMRDTAGAATLLKVASESPTPETVGGILTFLLEHDVYPKPAELEQWLTSDHPETKLRAYQLTAAAKDSKFTDALLKMHSSTEFGDRLIATHSLGYTKDARAATPLTSSLFEANEQIRLAAADGLVVLGHASTLGALERSLKGEKHPEVKLRVVDAVGAVGGKDALQLLRFQSRNNDPAFKLRTVEAIRTIGLKDGASVLDMFLKDRNVDVRWRAFLATLELDTKLGENHFGSIFRNPPAGFVLDLLELPAAPRDLAINYLLKNGAGSARDAAIAVAKANGNDDALYAIVQSSTADLSTRRDLVQYFGARGAKKDLMVLESLARGSDPTLARLAAWMLTRHPSASLEASFRGYLTARDETLRAIAAYGLATVWR